MAVQYIVERIMDELVILETPQRSHVYVPKTSFLTAMKQGDVVEQLEQGYAVNQEETERRRADMIRLTKTVFGENNNP